MVGIINYGCGNISSFINFFEYHKISYKIVEKDIDMTFCKKLILPGVGSFDRAVSQLVSKGLWDPLNDLVLNKDIPILGICVGMQIMTKGSEEGVKEGLGWFNTVVKKIPTAVLPLPHMGWNSLEIVKQNKLLYGIGSKDYFYFIHSFAILENIDNEHIVALTNYEIDFVSVINRKNIYGVQFHPEKSHSNGWRLLLNFLRD